jgi:UDP-glucose 4-epimerase
MNEFIKFKNSIILVTGGFGFIGKSFIKKIVKFPKFIFLIDNLSYSILDKSITEYKNVKFIKGDIRNKDILNSISKIDYIYHFGAPSSVVLFNKNPKECIDVTIRGLLNILNFAKEKKVKKLIYPSSGSVYGVKDKPANEKIIAPTPINIYGKTKLACEFIARTFEQFFPIVGLRIFAGFGPEENHKKEIASVITLFIKKMIKNESPVIFGDGNQTRDFVWIDDIVDTMIKVTFNNFNGVLNVGSGTSLSFNQIIKIINFALEKNIKPKYIKKPLNYLENTKADTALMKKILERNPTDPIKKIKLLAKLLKGNC